ncbi:teashirt homolog 3 [Trichomycterus rosablanca]|uniref:teashirt homolog 3 n=1 Tax=Trichomycterus rosablanca TaxID=2290929 RepID=UPI002F352D6C
MARRKQRAPRRAPAYDSEDAEESAMKIDSLLREASTTTKNPLSKSDFSEGSLFQKTETDQRAIAAELSETDSEAQIHESNETVWDVKGSSVNYMDKTMKNCPNEGSEKSLCGSNSLEQIKAIYNGFLSNSYWSSLSLNPSQSCSEKRSETSSSSSSSSSPGAICYDWHQSAVAKTLQQASEKQLPQREQSLFSTVQLYRQSSRVYGSVFTGASKFHCKSCSAAYDTLVDLTVHMNETGHYRDDNHEMADKGAKSWSKPRKRSLLELEGKEDAQKVLCCMYCGHSFESLQDLSVHMIKTKHYQKVPLKEHETSVTAVKVISSFSKRVPVELDITKPKVTQQKGSADGTQVNVSKNYDITKKDGVIDKNVIGSTPQPKMQILRCKDCGSSYETWQQLSAHIMLTGHFVKGSKTILQSGDSTLKQIYMPSKTKIRDNKAKKVTEGSSTSSPTQPTELPITPSLKNYLKEESKSKILQKEIKCIDHHDSNADERYNISSKCEYLTEEDLKESPKVNLDILKSLENTVTSAINNAQKGTPSWGGYQSIHAAYQLRNNLKHSLQTSGHVSSVNQPMHSTEVQSLDGSHHVPNRVSSPEDNQPTMKELVKEETEEATEESRNDIDQEGSPQIQCFDFFSISEERKSSSSSPNVERPENRVYKADSTENNIDKGDFKKCGKSTINSFLSFCDDAVITHQDSKQQFESPLNALQSVMNLHLGKVAKPVRPVQDPMSMLLKMSNSMAEKSSVTSSLISTSKPELLFPDPHQMDKDQPIDLSKGKRISSLATAFSPEKVLAASSSSTTRTDVITDTSVCPSVSPVHMNALSDISDMLRNLSDTHVSKLPTPSHKVEHSGIEGVQTPNEGDDASSGNKRKGRHSHWNPQHLLILQAQFTSCLRKTADGKYVITDLSSQERMVISRVTGLSMTTISHWLANVKYQLRRTGRTKFLKNVDSGHPVFFCNECAIQIQTRSTYLCHLESHLGFKLRDLTKFTCENLNKIARKPKDLETSFLPRLSTAAGAEQLYPVEALKY